MVNQEPLIESTVKHLTLCVNGIKKHTNTTQKKGVRKRICEFVIVLDTRCVSTKKSSKRDVVPVFCSPFINFQSRIISHAIVNPTTHSSSGWEELLPKISGPHCQTEYQMSVDNTNAGIGYVESEFKIAQNDFNRVSRTIYVPFSCV